MTSNMQEYFYANIVAFYIKDSIDLASKDILGSRDKDSILLQENPHHKDSRQRKFH